MIIIYLLWNVSIFLWLNTLIREDSFAILFLWIVGWQYDVYKDEMTQEVCSIFDIQHGAQCWTTELGVGSWGGHNLKLRATRLESKIQEPGSTKYKAKQIQINGSINTERKRSGENEAEQDRVTSTWNRSMRHIPYMMRIGMSVTLV